MPDRDGTGPTGKGPLTGKSSGSCILRIPDSQDEPIQGFAGEPGRPVSFGGKPQRVKEVLDMPRGDRTGSTGAGPGTGRMKGVCGGLGTLGIFNCCKVSGTGYGRSNRLNTGRLPAGLGSSTADAGFAPVPQLESLKAQARHLEETLDGIKRRMHELEYGAEDNQ